jgi:hypothetical protein
VTQKSLNLTYDWRFTGSGLPGFGSVIESNAQKVSDNFDELFGLVGVGGQVALDVAAGFIANAEAIADNLATLATALDVEVDSIDEAVDFLFTGAGVPGFETRAESNAQILEAAFTTLEESYMGLAADIALYNGFTTGVQQELTGDVIGTTLTAFTAAGADLDWPANVTENGAEIEVEAWLDVTGDGGANNYLGRLYWGGLATGVALNADTALGAQVANELRLRARVKYTTAGGTPSWESWADLTTPANNAYIQSKALFGQTTQPTNVAIPIQVAVQYSGGTPDASDKIKLRRLTARLVKPEVVVT